eukprot:8719697-Pyramimonas_sp.AAC.1
MGAALAGQHGPWRASKRHVGIRPRVEGWSTNAAWQRKVTSPRSVTPRTSAQKIFEAKDPEAKTVREMRPPMA